MDSYELTDDSKAILLLCGVFKPRSAATAPKPLTMTEYNHLVAALVANDLRPGDLLREDGVACLAASPEHRLDSERLRRLLERGAALAFAVEEWMNAGIWVLTRSDADYPAGFRKHLGKQSPPIIFGVGDRQIAQTRGLAVVGSRNVDAGGEAYTRDVGAHCGAHGILIVSGGARGVDQLAMTAALEAGGGAIGVLANNLLRASVSGESREAIQDQRLLLLSPYHPKAGFNVGNAMRRNKYIYALARCALIISADAGKGGTWAGAVEELKRRPHIPVFVRQEGDIPNGNRELLTKGAIPFPEHPWPDTLLDQLEQYAAGEQSTGAVQAGLFDAAAPNPPEAGQSAPLTATATASPPEPPVASLEAAQPASPPADFYTAILPVLLNGMASWMTLEQLLDQFDIRKTQLQDWLKKAVDEGKVEKQYRPTRYRRRNTAAHRQLRIDHS